MPGWEEGTRVDRVNGQMEQPWYTLSGHHQSQADRGTVSCFLRPLSGDIEKNCVIIYIHMYVARVSYPVIHNRLDIQCFVGIKPLCIRCM